MCQQYSRNKQKQNTKCKVCVQIYGIAHGHSRLMQRKISVKMNEIGNKSSERGNEGKKAWSTAE